MKKEFMLAFNEVLEDRKLPKEVVMEALEAAMISAYRKAVNASTAQQVLAEIDLDSGNVSIFAEKEVVEEVQDERTEVVLEKALEVDPEAEIGGIVVVESTPENFGRVAAQTARQVIQQRIREAEREAQRVHFSKLTGEIVSGIVQAANPHVITMGLDRKAEGRMPRKEQIPGERFRIHDRVRAMLLEVKSTPRGPEIILSRGHKNFLRRLMEDEVPEIYHGLVEIRSIAREPGHRSKVAVFALQPGIDPVGACVGIRGVRIQAIVRELNDEKIDVIEWNPDPHAFIAKALSPSRVSGVYLEENDETKTATVVVPEDQLSLTIGRNGQNARLAARLTGWRIDIKSLSEAAGEALKKVLTDPEHADDAETLAETIPQIEATLKKKAEGRPLTPEEYTTMSLFVDRVEKGVITRREAEMEALRERKDEILSHIPDSAFDIPLDELGLSPRMTITLTGEGYSAIGDLMYQLAFDLDEILKINGVGPKTMEEIDAKLAEVEFPEPEVVEEEVEPAAEGVEEVDEAAEGAGAEGAGAESAGAEEAPEGEALEGAEAAADTEAEAEAVGAEEAGEDEEPVEAAVEEVEDVDAPTEDTEEKKKKKKFRELEYDPDLDVTILKRRRKSDDDTWGEEWEK